MVDGGDLYEKEGKEGKVKITTCMYFLKEVMFFKQASCIWRNVRDFFEYLRPPLLR